MLGGTYQPPNETLAHAKNWPQPHNHPDLQCLLLTQPVSEYTVESINNINAFWDVNCPIANHTRREPL